MFRLLYIIDNMDFGGGERVFLQLIAGLKDQYEVFVAAGSKGKFENDIRKLGVSFFTVDMRRKFSIKPIFHLRSIIHKKKVGIVHSQGARADFFARSACSMAKSAVNVCTLAMPVEGFDISPLRKMTYRSIDWLTERYVDKFIVVSDSLKKNLMENRKIPGHRVVRIYNGIELDQYHPETESKDFRKEWNLASEVPLVGAIGRMVWQKGFEFLIKAAPVILQAFPDARFMIVGEGPLRGELGALSEELRVKDNVIFAGFRSDIKEVLSAIDLLVVPSLLEGFPMVTLEAMAMAKPVIATNIDGIIEQITDGENGILVPPKDHLALAGAILRLIQDKELSIKLGMSARKKVEQEFSVEKMVAETEKVYLSLIETKQI